MSSRVGTRPENGALLVELFDAITEFPLIVIGAAVVVDDFNKLSAEFRKGLMDPWYLCYHSCFHEAMTTTFWFDPKFEAIAVEDLRIRACFYELHRQFTWGPILFEMAREAAKEWAGNYENGIIGFGSKRTSVHFQLADLIAYEIRKHVENAIYKEGRPTRWPMKQFLKGFMIVNIFDNGNTEIPVESGAAMFRNASVADMETNRLIASLHNEHRLKKVLIENFSDLFSAPRPKFFRLLAPACSRSSSLTVFCCSDILSGPVAVLSICDC